MHYNNSKKNKKKDKVYFWYIIVLKILIITFLVGGFLMFNTSKDNSISVLSVQYGSDGEIHPGGILDIELEVTRGSGNIYTNLDTLGETDTQVSIINSNQIACNLFDLDCHNYDFHFTIKGDALRIEGPSASSAIAILTAKTLNNQHIDDTTTITGTLSSGGIIGNVGGIPQKVSAAENAGFEKVIVPGFYRDEIPKDDIEVIRSVDIINAYNHFSGASFTPQQRELDFTNYNDPMEHISNELCNRGQELESKLDKEKIKENSEQKELYEDANQSIVSAQRAGENENFYSKGSFCYNSNINFKTIYMQQSNYSYDELKNISENFLDEVKYKENHINSHNFREEVKTINDFYIYLILQDRIQESIDYLEEGLESDDENLSITQIQENLDSLEDAYSFAHERKITANLWEEMIGNQEGREVDINTHTLNRACQDINIKLKMKNEVLLSYGADFFEDEIEEQNKLQQGEGRNPYLCVYRGLENLASINSVLNTVNTDIDLESQTIYAETLLNFIENRLSMKDEEEFPVIPYTYYEYSGDLIKEQNLDSAILYANYAIVFSDLNYYLEEEKSQSKFNELFNELFDNPLFLGALLVILAFLN